MSYSRAIILTKLDESLDLEIPILAIAELLANYTTVKGEKKEKNQPQTAGRSLALPLDSSHIKTLVSGISEFLQYKYVFAESYACRARHTPRSRPCTVATDRNY